MASTIRSHSLRALRATLAPRETSWLQVFGQTAEGLLMSLRTSTGAVARVLVASVLALLVVSCSSQPSHDDLNRVLDAYPLPESFQLVSATDYTFGVGPFGDEANAVARYFDPGALASSYDAIVAVAAQAGIEVEDPTEDDIRLERIHVEYQGVNVVIFTGAAPIEVRAFGPLS